MDPGLPQVQHAAPRGLRGRAIGVSGVSGLCSGAASGGGVTLQSGVEATVGGRPRSWFGLFWLSRLRLCMFWAGVVLDALVGLSGAANGRQATLRSWLRLGEGGGENREGEKEDKKKEKREGGG